MNYLQVTRKVYDMLEQTDCNKLLKSWENDYDEFRTFMLEKFGINEIISAYKTFTTPFLEKHLSFNQDILKKFLSSEEIKYYESHMPLRTAFYLFWIWDKQLEISEEKLEKFIESFYIGTFGYKMMDVVGDSKNVNAEMIFIALYAIKAAEDLLSYAFGYENTSLTILKNLKIYANVECFEKKSRWKETPFSWDEAEKLGNKAAPIYMVYETLFRYAKYNEQKINDLMYAFNLTAAALQMVDDLMDAKIDLANGFETLVMSGYYSRFGFEGEIADEKVAAVLNQERLKKIYTTVMEYFTKARTIFEKYDEYIILLSHEMQLFNINKIFEVK